MDRCHFMDGGFMHLQFGGNLPIGKIQAHKIETEHPNGERQAMTGEHGIRQIIKGTVTFTAKIVLASGLGGIVPVFDNGGGVAVGTVDTFGPAKVSNHLVTFGIVDQSVNVETHLV